MIEVSLAHWYAFQDIIALESLRGVRIRMHIICRLRGKPSNDCSGDNLVCEFKRKVYPTNPAYYVTVAYLNLRPNGCLLQWLERSSGFVRLVELLDWAKAGLTAEMQSICRRLVFIISLTEDHRFNFRKPFANHPILKIGRPAHRARRYAHSREVRIWHHNCHQSDNSFHSENSDRAGRKRL